MPKAAAKAKATPRTVRRLAITEARRNLGEVVKRVRIGKEYVILEKDGIPVAGLMDIDELEDYLELQDPKIGEQIRKSNEEYLAGKGRPARELLTELGGERPRRKRRPSQRRR